MDEKIVERLTQQFTKLHKYIKFKLGVTHKMLRLDIMSFRNQIFKLFCHVGEHKFRRKSMCNATKRPRTENASRSNRLLGRNQVNFDKFQQYINYKVMSR